jgi:hypothetical protein
LVIVLLQRFDIRCLATKGEDNAGTGCEISPASSWAMLPLAPPSTKVPSGLLHGGTATPVSLPSTMMNARRRRSLRVARTQGSR